MSKAQSWTNNDFPFHKVILARSSVYYVKYVHLSFLAFNLDDHKEVKDDAGNTASISPLHFPWIILIWTR